jgi:hypothetical protein
LRNKSYIYLASPYTGKEQERYEAVLKYTALETQKGEVIFSPIVHSHPLTRCGVEMPGTWDFWQHIDRTFIDYCEELHVLCLDGWDKSVGVKAEIEYAQSIGKHIEYRTP